MAKSRKATESARSVPVDSIKHKDPRKNIPTEEQRDFVREEENRPSTVLYPRDPSLDPQLVWKGKDEQDRDPLTVPAVPIYIQEKIHLQAISEDFRRTADKRSDNDDADFGCLFDDFNGLDADFDRKVDFYQHDQRWYIRVKIHATKTPTEHRPCSQRNGARVRRSGAVTETKKYQTKPWIRL